MSRRIFLSAVLLLVVSSYGFCCVQLRNPLVSVNEADRRIEVCAMFTAVVTGGGQVRLASSITAAARSPDDFNTIDIEFDIPINNINDACTNITIKEDNVFEIAEVFAVTLTSSNIEVCTGVLNPGFITIVDTTELPVRFEESVYTSINEQGVVDVCLLIPNNFEYDRGVVFSQAAVTSGNTAGAGDFIFAPTSNTVSARDVTRLCQEVQILPDVRVESDEFFSITVTTSDNVILEGGNTMVVISDDDGASVRLVSEATTIREGNLNSNMPVEFCIELTSTLALDRDVIVLANTQQLTAVPGDYQELVNEMLTIPSGSTQGFEVCSNVVVIGDPILEPDEGFSVVLSPENNNDVVTTTAFRVTIENDGDVIRDCGPLLEPPNTFIALTGTVQGSTATYSCAEGFFIPASTNSFRVCLPTGLWSTPIPACEIRNCGLLPDPGNGAIIYSPDTFFQGIAINTCNAGFVLRSGGVQFNRTCQANGMWSGIAPICDEVQCPPLAMPSDGNLAIDGFDFEDEAVYTCTFGFTLSSGGESLTRICQSNSTWSNVEPTCDLVDCGMLPSINNGSVAHANSQPLSTIATGLGDIATYTCVAGFTLLGSATRECTIDGEWTNSEPSCADLRVTIEVLSMESEVAMGNSITLNGTALGIPDSLLSRSNMSWINITMETAISEAAITFLELELIDVQLEDNGIYICRLVIESDLLERGSITVDAEYTLAISISIPPVSGGLTPSPSSDTTLIIGIAAGLGVGLILVIVCVGLLVVCGLCWRKKKNYRKYVLPYRAYMDAYKNNHVEDRPLSSSKNKSKPTIASDIRQWENGRREHVLDAVSVLDKYKK